MVEGLIDGASAPPEETPKSQTTRTRGSAQSTRQEVADSVADELAKLVKLRAAGELTPGELAALKAKLIEGQATK